MKLLVLGGTLFLGRHLVDAALAAGHEVTLFNRGRTNPDLFPEVEKLRGDRAAELHLLDGRRWDAVVDTCGYLPGVVRASAMRLRDSVEHYTFISSISVYADPVASGATEEAPLHELDPALADAFDAERYGGLKALCERAVAETFPGRSLIVRSGLLAGPHDPTGRLPYWIDRVSEGGELLATAPPERRIQLIHARDMSDWIVRMAEARHGGAFNVTGPASPYTMAGLLEAIGAVTGAPFRPTWVSEEFLVAEGVTPWTELPLWVPEEWGGVMDVRVERAVEAGLALRALEDTVRDTFDWMRSGSGTIGALTSGMKLGATLSRDREASLLTTWRAQGGGPTR